MYVDLPDLYALASNWREAGVHVKSSQSKKDFPTLEFCAIALQEFPDDLVRFDWDAWDETIPEEKRIFELEGGEKVKV